MTETHSPIYRRPKRAQIEHWIECLIGYLDHLDGDADFEPLMSCGAAEWSTMGIYDGRELDPSEYETNTMIFGGNEKIRTSRS